MFIVNASYPWSMSAALCKEKNIYTPLCISPCFGNTSPLVDEKNGQFSEEEEQQNM